MTHLELFAGIGGIAAASEWAGFEHVGFVERDPFCQKVLAKHWPHVPIYDDVRTFDGTKFRGVDLISGGFPCQPHSLAGSRKASGDERDLWGEVVRIVGEAKPRWFLGENVPGLLSSESGRFFGRVVDDLAALRYRVGFCMYGASDVGAVHRRNRVFIVAYSDCGGPQDGRGFNGSEMGRCDSRWGGSTVLGSAAPECGLAGHPDCQRRQEFSDRIATGTRHFNGGITGDSEQQGLEGARESGSATDSDAADAEHNGPPRGEGGRGFGESEERWRVPQPERRITANASRISDGQADTPANTIGNGREPRNYVGWGDRPSDWREWGVSPTVRIEPRVRGSHDGISNRVDRLKALGNAVVPQQIYPILKAIAEASK